MSTKRKLKALNARPIASLVPYARNSRTHSVAQVNQLVALIKAYGWTSPVLEDAEGIVAGHGRVMAANQIYDEGGTIYMAPGEADGGEALPPGTVPTLDVTGWSDAKRRGYVIADNQSALQAGWNEELLKLELHALDGLGFDLSLTAFDGGQLSEIMFGEALKQDEKNSANPDPGAGNYQEQFGVIVVCNDAAAQESAYNTLVEMGYNCKVVCT